MIQVVPSPAPEIPPVPSFPFWQVLPAPVLVIIALAVVAGAAVVLFPLVRALARRIEGRQQLDPALLDELEQLRTRVGEVDGLHHRVAELEERVDFAERLLAQRSAPERLREGK